MAFFSSHPFSPSPPLDPQVSSPAVEGSAPPADIHTMPGKFMAQEKKVSWFRQRMTLGILIIAVLGGGMGLAAWLFVRTLKAPASPTPQAPAAPAPSSPAAASPEPSVPQVALPPQEPVTPPPTAPAAPAPEPAPAPQPPIEPPPVEPPVSEPPPPVILPLSRDSDGDEMTDVEEGLWGVDPLQPDTDADGYLDGQELLALFDPARGGGARLDQAVQVRTYVNPQLQYTMLVPASWGNRLIDPTTALQTLFTASTGEFVSVIAQQNLEGHSSARDWYASEYSAVNPDTLPAITTATLKGIMSADGLAAYFIDGGYLFVISYNPGILESVNFKTTYRMMVQSFRTFVQP